MVSMQWGAWSGAGMAAEHNLLPRVRASGLGVLAPTRGLAALRAALALGPGPGYGPAQRVVSPFDWRRLMAGARSVFPVFAEFAADAAAPGAAAGAPALAGAEPSAPGQTLSSGAAERGRAGGQNPPQTLAPATAERRQEDTLAEVQGVVARLLGPGVSAHQVRRLPPAVRRVSALPGAAFACARARAAGSSAQHAQGCSFATGTTHVCEHQPA
jgi:hypothetical protein